MHAFLSNLANRQTDKQTRAKTCTSSFVGGNNDTHSTRNKQHLDGRLDMRGNKYSIVSHGLANIEASMRRRRSERIDHECASN